MGTLEQKINYLKQTKQEIANAIRSKGIEVSDTDSFRSYASKIETIEGGNSNNYVTLDGEQIITGQKSFTTIPILESSPSLDNHSANKKYIDDSIDDLNMSLGQEIANNKKILSGGLSGQILTKKTNTDYDVEWSESNIGNLSTLKTENKNNLVDAINDCVVNYIDNQVVPTNEYLNGKRVYAYRYSFSQALTKDTEVIFDLPFASEIDYAWVDFSNCYFDNKKNTTTPNIWCMGTKVGHGFIIGISNLSNLYIMPDDNWNNTWTYHILIKFTKKGE